MRAGIAVVCRMARLEIFGSVAGGADFDPGIGDADFQVEFGHQARVGDMDLAGDLHVLLDREGNWSVRSGTCTCRKWSASHAKCSRSSAGG